MDVRGCQSNTEYEMEIEFWEYKIVHFGAERWTNTGLPDDLNIQLDRLGLNGWELVAIHAISRPTLFPWGGSKTTAVVAYLKRRTASRG